MSADKSFETDKFLDPILNKIIKEHPDLTENVKMHYGDFITIVYAMCRRQYQKGAKDVLQKEPAILELVEAARLAFKSLSTGNHPLDPNQLEIEMKARTALVFAISNYEKLKGDVGNEPPTVHQNIVF